MRYERKYTFFEHSIQSFRNRIKSLGFKLAFPTRQVSSLYYDTFDFKLYQISEAGISERKKIRLRWYDLDEDTRLEYKVKKAEIGNKLFPDNFRNYSSEIPLSFRLPKNKIKSIIKVPKVIDHVFLPKVIVTYIRDYYISNLGDIRITFDYQINYSYVVNNFRDLKGSYWIPEENSVVEMKYDYLSENNNLIESIVKKLSTQTSRFSKYCNAISLIYN